uniref:Interferon-induced protein with tetratricopeptide repeats 5 n=1 Tax=Lygus hesperus TaxID=30085 RepID=A0A0A9WIW2_LYGHE
MEKSSKDLEGVLKDCQCHFNWSLEEYEEFYSDPKLRVVEYIERYNSQEPHIFRNKFRTSLYLAYIMYRDGFDGWDKLLENGFRIMESTRDPDYPQGLNLLPSIGSPLYAGSSKNFFAYGEDQNQTSNVVNNHQLDSDDESEDEETYEGVEEQSLDGLYVAVEHIFLLTASILFRIGSSPSEVHEVLSHAVRMNDMTQRDRAALLFMKANTIRNCGVKGLDVAVDILKLCVLTDPDDLKYPLFLINYLGEIRRYNWGCSVNKSEIQSLIEVIDSVLQHDLEPWMKVKYQFNKLQAINQMIYSNRKEFSPQEHSLLHQTCCELCKMITENTKKSRVISYCAQFYSKDKNNLPEALRLIEKALEKKPDDTYINAKACNIFRKGGRLDKALECAEKAAARGFGSCWQLLELKLALKHDFDHEEFFRSILQNYPQDYQVRRTHKNAAFFYAIRGDFKRSLEHFTDFLLDSSDYDDNDFAECYCNLNRKTIHPVEAAYNIALYVLNSEYELDDGRDRSRMLDLGNAVKTKIEG